MTQTVDFVRAPNPDECVAANVIPCPYGGSGRPSQDWFDACRARGIDPLWMIYESYSTRSQLDARFGAWDCQGHEARAKEVGHTGANAVAVSDGNGADSWDASAYGQGWASVATMPFFAYGAPGVIASFEQGAACPLLIPGGWIPETWGKGLIAAQLVGPQAALSTPHDLNDVFHDFAATPAPGGFLMALTDAEQRELLDNTRQIVQGAPQFGQPALNDLRNQIGGTWATVTGQGGLPPLADVVAAKVQPVDVDAVVAAAVNAVAASPKGTPATKAAIKQLVETAIRGAL